MTADNRLEYAWGSLEGGDLPIDIEISGLGTADLPYVIMLRQGDDVNRVLPDARTMREAKGRALRWAKMYINKHPETAWRFKWHF